MGGVKNVLRVKIQHTLTPPPHPHSTPLLPPQAFVYGDNKPYTVLLLALDFLELKVRPCYCCFVLLLC